MATAARLCGRDRRPAGLGALLVPAAAPGAAPLPAEPAANIVYELQILQPQAAGRSDLGSSSRRSRYSTTARGVS